MSKSDLAHLTSNMCERRKISLISEDLMNDYGTLNEYLTSLFSEEIFNFFVYQNICLMYCIHIVNSFIIDKIVFRNMIHII